MTAATEAPWPGSSGAANAPGHRVPEFFVVGHPKCGTSALVEMVRRHPQIYMPELKEIWYFSPEELLSPKRQKLPPELPKTLDEYLALFERARPDQRVGESSPEYLLSTRAAARIAAVQPDARIVAILREPASFLRSFHLQCLQNYVETEKDFGKAIALEPARREGKRIPPYSRPHELLYSNHVRYVEQLRRYEAVFPRERMLVLIYDDYRRDNEGTVRKVLRFLEVDDAVPIEPVEANPSVSVRSPQLNEAVRSVYMARGPVSRAVSTGVRSITSRRMRKRLLRAAQFRLIYGEPKPADERVTLALRRRFKGEVVALSEHLERDLVSEWGYDRLD